jgi:hypothetical protein
MRLNARPQVADDTSVTAEQTLAAQHPCPCGIAPASQVQRCVACPARGRRASDSELLSGPERRTTDPEAAAALMSYSRWKKTDGTFGPAGRIIATVLLLVPLPVFALGVATGIGIIGAGLWVIVAMPWALRDIWKRGATHVQPPLPAPGRPQF